MCREIRGDLTYQPNLTKACAILSIANFCRILFIHNQLASSTAPKSSLGTYTFGHPKVFMKIFIGYLPMFGCHHFPLSTKTFLSLLPLTNFSFCFLVSFFILRSLLNADLKQKYFLLQANSTGDLNLVCQAPPYCHYAAQAAQPNHWCGRCRKYRPGIAKYKHKISPVL